LWQSLVLHAIRQMPWNYSEGGRATGGDNFSTKQTWHHPTIHIHCFVVLFAAVLRRRLQDHQVFSTAGITAVAQE
jgi:hypothetical protein